MAAIYRAAQAVITNSTSDQAIVSFTIPANTIVAAQSIVRYDTKLTLRNRSGGDKTYTITIKVGGSSNLVYALTVPDNFGGRYLSVSGDICFVPTSSPYVTSTVSLSEPWGDPTGGGDSTLPMFYPPNSMTTGVGGSPTSALSFEITIRVDDTTATQQIIRRHALVEVV